MGKAYLTVADVVSELGIARSTLYVWLATGRGPKFIRLPNGGIRFRESDLKEWLHKLESEER
nr:helix-turn-helix domain-containing protein [Actinocorallia herbida]